MLIGVEIYAHGHLIMKILMQSKKKKNLIKMKGNKNLHMIIMNIEMIQKILKIKMIIMNENKI